VGNNSDNDNSDGGYKSDSEGSYYDKGEDAMMTGPVENVREAHIRKFIRDTGEVKHHPEEARIDPELDAAEHQKYIDRHL